jgi:hypothetical protein
LSGYRGFKVAANVWDTGGTFGSVVAAGGAAAGVAGFGRDADWS